MNSLKRNLFPKVRFPLADQKLAYDEYVQLRERFDTLTAARKHVRTGTKDLPLRKRDIKSRVHFVLVYCKLSPTFATCYPDWINHEIDEINAIALVEQIRR